MSQSGQSTYNPPGLNKLAYLTGGGNQVNGVKAYEVRKIFSIAEQDWLLSDGVRKSFLLNGGWQDPITGLTGFSSMSKLPARPGQYWKITWLARFSCLVNNAETGHSLTLGFRITNPTNGTEEYQQVFPVDANTDAEEATMSIVVSPKTSLTWDLTQNSLWTRFSCFGELVASGSTSTVRLNPFNEIILELWNGPFPNTNRLQNAGVSKPDLRFEIQPQNF